MTGYEMAVEFCKKHEMPFARAAAAANTEDRQFQYSADEFDDFLVSIGELSVAARHANDDLSRDGVVRLREKLRRRLIRSAQSEKRLQRNFTIEAWGRTGRGRTRSIWRVLLLERYVAERPREIVLSLRRSAQNCDRSLLQAEGFLKGDNHLPDDERIMVQSQLAYLRIQMFTIMNTAQVIMQAIQDGTVPDFKLLSRQFATLLADPKGKRRRKVGKSK
jgi:hypothetical protein